MNRVRSFAAFAAVAGALAGAAAGAPAGAAGDPATASSSVPANSAAAPAAPASPVSDAFYLSRLRIGEQALSAGRAAEAADNLRVASFGLLDEPEKLSESLVWLALAQQRAGRGAEADATLRRFQSVQALFPSWGRLDLDPGMRREFEALLRKRLPGSTLESPREAERGPTPPPAPPVAPSAEAGPPVRPVPAAPAQAVPAPPATTSAGERPSAAPVREASASAPTAVVPRRVPALPSTTSAGERPTTAPVREASTSTAPPPVVPRPVPVAVVLEKPPAPRPVAVRPPPSPEVPPASATSASFPKGFADREVRTRRAVIFQIRPDQARLYVDGRYVGVSADWGGGEGRPFPLAAGEHAVRAVLPGYRELRIRVVADPSLSSDAIAAAELPHLERRSFRRIPRPDYVTSGRIAFAPELRGAAVAVDGEPNGAADRFTVSAPMRLTGPAVHDLVLSRPGRPARTIRVLASPTAGSDLVVVRAVL
jgi:hypothetical protein